MTTPYECDVVEAGLHASLDALTPPELDSASGCFSPDEWPSFDGANAEGKCPDHFIEKDGEVFAGTHLIADFWQASELDNLELMEAAMRQAVQVAGATLLHIHLHHFTPNGGISGVAVLAESHLSVHSWPERGFAAFDVFMCGDAKPELAIDELAKAFQPQRLDVKEYRRGKVQ